MYNNVSKIHYKMYKSGKRWLISGITTAAVVISISDFVATNKVFADEQRVEVGSNVTASSNVNSVTSVSTVSSTVVSASSSNATDSSNSNTTNQESAQFDETSSAVQSFVDEASSAAATNSAANSYYQLAQSESKKLASNANSSDNQSVYSATSNFASLAKSTASSANSSASSSAASNASSSSVASTSVQSLPTDGSFATTDGGQTVKYLSKNNPVKGLYISNGNTLYFNNTDGTQVKGNIVNTNNANYYFDKDTGNGYVIKNNTGGSYREQKDSAGTSIGWGYVAADGSLLKGLQGIDGSIQYFDPNTGVQLKGGTVVVGGQAYFFEANLGNLVGTVSQIVNDGQYTTNNGVTQYLDASGKVVKGLTSINNHLQYFDLTTGEEAKNKQVVANGVTYYFDNYGNGQYLFTNTGKPTKTDMSRHNVANSTDPVDYKNNVDGFLTAESWYRPKDILDGGTTWRSSKSTDFRPIITVWWPNKDVEVNYLKLMQDNGLLAKDTQYDLFSDQAVLDQAAQAAQVEIEKRIKKENSTDWLNSLLFKGTSDNPSFINKQYIWNLSSESQWQGDAWFQGGYLKYNNSNLTPTTDSDYRNTDNYFDFLLANDVDNSNPVVQAEDLNWLHYLMNFGSITTNGKEKDANFDSIRLDAVDFVSNDVIQRTYDYMRDAYKLSQNDANANNHISLVEAGADAGTTTYNSDALIENSFRELAQSSLTNGPGKNTSLSNLITETDSGVVIADHSNNSTDSGIPNYSIIHAHDKGIQEKIGAAITDTTGADWTNFTADQLKTGLAAYYNDQRSTVKKYNSYNLPSAYAIMLTNKGTVPRIYYGDMYQDDGQYMQNKSLYYDAISSLMTARKQYVAGGQTMSVDDNGFLKSVRFGKGAETANDAGTKDTRTEGIGLIVGNDPSVNLKDDSTVTLNMGAAHKNQAYRALMLTTKDGIQTYESDKDAPVAYTDDNGVLTFSNKDINNQANTSVQGTLNPQVSGYVAAWVPVGASDSQDARTAASTTTNTDGKVLHSSDALDSNLIYEGFSNFQPMPTTNDERTNVVISKNAKQFSDWGITSFEMAPQYKSSDDNSFLDSTIQNGYAFSDRYDLGLSSPTKYGSAEDLRNAIKALHQSGMQVMADLVLNQVYNLPGKEVVSANRAGVYGNDAQVPFGNQLYVVNTIGGGQYQQQYGGEFLKEIQAKYPDLFNAKSYDYYWKNYADNGAGPTYLSTNSGTRSAIPSNEKLKQWSAKYMNGTNILGRGMGYVLKDWNTGQYFKIDSKNTVLPLTLSTDFVYKDGWSENDDGTWSYYDENSGNRLTGNQTVNGQQVYFDQYGIQVKGDWVENSDGSWSYYDNASGVRLTGSQQIDGKQFYFDASGSQVKGRIVQVDGELKYFDPNSGRLVTNKQITVGRISYNADSNGFLTVIKPSSADSSEDSSASSSASSASNAASSASSAQSSNANSGSAINSNAASTANDDGYVLYALTSGTVLSGVSGASGASGDRSLASLSSGTASASSSVTIDSSANPAVLSLNASVAANASDNFKNHIKEVNGKYYYYANGSAVANSMLISDNGSYYYFGQDGYLTADDPLFSGASGTITTDSNNAAYSNTASSIDNVDGFLTVNTWYRPKSILKDGTTWTPSTENDYRPLLSVWWPSKQVEINYLNYMAQKGLSNSATFTNDASQDELNIAAKQVQANIEKQITANNGSTTWLLNIFNTFIKTQSQWNINSEEYNVNDGYQGGTLSYQNSPLTPNTNTDYRLLNRNPSQQDGKLNYTTDASTGTEFLLANDVDNSNPVVQAENLNWLYYLTNFGSITQNNANANFDSIRVDATDNIDADVLNIASDYFKDAYKTDQSEKNANDHLSIIEGWSNNDSQYQNDNGNDQLTLDNGLLTSVRSALFANPSQRANLSTLINYSLVNRANDTTENTTTPNYSFVRAHDAGVQDIIAQIIKDNINKKSNGLVVTSDELAQAFKIYDQDQQQTDKKYTQYNVPSAYALLLTNKDTVPRVYYGDMYTDDGQFMANKTPYFDSISTLLKGRIKYVAGGQSMNTTNFGNNNSVLTSVRYGKGADTVSDSGTSETRTSGIAVVESNNPQLQLGSTDKVVINMGAAHKNQAYRPLIESSDQGLVNYDNDTDASQQVVYTNENGQLILDANTIKGYSNPQVSGYLSAWVPVGASASQDIRTAPSTAKNTSGKTLNSNSALDSNVIYEGFSNFQAQPTTPDEYSNVIIAKNADLFNSWGVSYMQLPPQYRSTTDNSFVDSTVQNGYSFSDRYDLGFINPTKYGTADQLTSAIESLHSTGIKVMADYVPDQLYSLPNKQVVSVNRTDSNGNIISGTWIKNILYDASTKGSGDDYQSKYGGEFLDQLEKMYPDLFTTKQISTGQTIDPSTKIKTWEAKYFNGTNIQGAGTGAVLSNVNGADYFTVQTDTNTGVKTTMLPKQLMGEDVTYGLTTVNGVKQYVSTSGYVAKNTFLQDDNGNWYYLDANGTFVDKPDDINDNNYYFLSNGMNLRNFVLKSPDGKLYYYQKTGGKVTASGYYYNKSKDKFIYVNSDGSLAQGLVTDGTTTRYYNDDGTQLKGGFATINGNRYYFDGGLGSLVKGSFFTNNNNWYYANADGNVVTGDQTIGDQQLYFNDDGSQVKGQFVTANNSISYYDLNSGALKKSQFFLANNNWYYADDNGKLLTGLQTVNNQELYFNSDGSELKGGITTVNGKMMNFDGQTGSLTKNTFFTYNGDWYYSDANGDLLTGKNTVNGQQLYFNADGTQVKGSIVKDNNGSLQYYDVNSGNLVVNQDVTYNGINYHADENGILTELGADSNANSNGSSAGSSASSNASSSSGSNASSSAASSGSSNASSSTNSNGSSANSGSSNASSSANSNGSSANSGSSNSSSSANSNGSSANSGSSNASSSANSNGSSANSGSSNASSSSNSNGSSANSSSSNANSSANSNGSSANSSSSNASSSANSNGSSANSGSSNASSSTNSNGSSANSGSSNASSSANSNGSSANSGSSNASSSANSNGSIANSGSSNASSSANSGSSSATLSGSSSASSNSASSGSSNASSSANSSSSSANNSNSSSASNGTINNSSNASSSSQSNNAASSNNSSNTANTGTSTGGNASSSTNNYVNAGTGSNAVVDSNANSSASSATGSSNSTATSTNSSSASHASSAQSSSATLNRSKAAKSAAAAKAHAKAVKKAKAKMDKSIKAMKAAKAALAKHQTKRALAKYQKALKTYYKHEKAYLKTNGQYSNKFYYDFNLPNKAKLAKTTFVYSSKSLNSDDKVGKLKAGTKIKIKKVVVDKQTTRFNLGQGKFINGLKSMINKIK